MFSSQGSIIKSEYFACSSSSDVVFPMTKTMVASGEAKARKDSRIRTLLLTFLAVVKTPTNSNRELGSGKSTEYRNGLRDSVNANVAAPVGVTCTLVSSWVIEEDKAGEGKPGPSSWESKDSEVRNETRTRLEYNNAMQIASNKLTRLPRYDCCGADIDDGDIVMELLMPFTSWIDNGRRAKTNKQKLQCCKQSHYAYCCD